MFIDKPPYNGKKDPGEISYSDSFTVSYTSASYGTGSIDFPASANGAYSLNTLLADTYAVRFILPTNSPYRFTYPLTPFNALIASIGSSAGSCVYPTGSSDALCTSGTNCTSAGAGCSGGITNLNAGVTTDKLAWFQSIGSDMRWDRGFNDVLPSITTYASLPGAGGMPGIIFSGPITPNLGPSIDYKASNPENWKVWGNTSDTLDIFTAPIATSYDVLKSKVESLGITPNAITSVTFPNGITQGVYKTDNNGLNINAPVVFGSGNFGAGKFIILVEGDLNINKNITVPSGSTVIFSASRDITIDSSVTQIQGLYSANRNFTVNGISNCPGTVDNPLNVAGTAVVNAGRSGGSFVNNRNLCGGNNTNPSVSFIERPDFLLNYPSIIQQTTRTWQEGTP